MIKHFLFICLLLFGFKMVIAQQIALGSINNNEIIISDKASKALKTAYLRSFIDGRKLDSVYLTNIGQIKQLVLLGSKTNVKSKTALSISMINNTVYLNPMPMMKTCSNGACADCDFFIENNQVVACKCVSKSSISNHCTFKINDGNLFYTLVAKLIAP